MTDLPPAGRYVADPSHTSVHFRIKHLALSWYTGRFAKAAATLDFDPADLAATHLDASVEIGSVAMFYAGTDKNWNKELAESEQFLDALTSPTARFVSERVTKTGDHSADVAGQLTFRGQSRPFTFRTVMNGAMLDHPSGIPMIGFSATGVMKRSDYGLTFGLSPRMPDDVQIIVEAEFAKQGDQA